MVRLRNYVPTLFSLPSFYIFMLCLTVCNSDEQNDVSASYSTSSNETYETNSYSSLVSNTYEDRSWNSNSAQSPLLKNWCGRSFEGNNSEASATPSILSKPLLNFRCTPRVKPYLETDDPELGGFIVDASLTYYPVKGAIEISDNVKQLQIIFINTNNSRAITAGIIEVNTVGNVFPFPLTVLGETSVNPYHISCQAYAKDEYISENSVSLAYLPNRDGKQQAARTNAESGTMSVTNQNGTLETLIPFGFAIDYDRISSPSQLTEVIKYLEGIKVNTIQLILGPGSISDTSHLNRVFTESGKAGFWVQYDMRNIYWNKNLVNTHLNIAKHHPNFLLYHTAMEPDGQTINADILSETNQFIEQHDSYHPTSLTLSCEDYYFSNYTEGSDVVLTNPFVIGTSNDKGHAANQVPYTSTYGSPTCDGCKGSFVDLVNRIRIFRNRRHLSGRDRNMQLWAVPQATSISSDLNQVPTGEQFLLMSTIYIIEGVVGLMTWDSKMDLSEDLRKAIQTLGESLPLIGKYLEMPQSFLPLPPVTTYPSDKFIANIWLNRVDQSMLVMVANLAEKEVTWEIDLPYFPSTTKKLQTSWIYVSSNCSVPHLIQKHGKTSLKSKLEGYGFGAWIVKPEPLGH